MTRDALNTKYFEWMCRLVYDKGYFNAPSYSRLLSHLHDLDFTYTIAMDGNRAADGIDLRYRFGYENDCKSPIIATYLDDCPCSVLEMMIALALRCEEHIMNDYEIGDRTAKWFGEMIYSLGLENMQDDNMYDKEYVDHVIDIFLNREYDRNGAGGLFTIENSSEDLRTIEIWYQMCWYLDSILRKKGV